MLVTSPKALAARCIDQRKQLKQSQTDVGDDAAIRQGTVSAFERHPEKTKLETLFRILSSLELELHIVPKGEDPGSQGKGGGTDSW